MQIPVIVLSFKFMTRTHAEDNIKPNCCFATIFFHNKGIIHICKTFRMQ